MLQKSHLFKLRASGERLTPVRLALAEILIKNKRPLTPPEILLSLKKKGIKVNKTTIYRQLESLQKFNLIQEVYFTDNIKRYELVDEAGHHHHLVCLRCGGVEDISFPTELEKQEKKIWQKSKFKVLRHSLEFFGICKNCQTKKLGK